MLRPTPTLTDSIKHSTFNFSPNFSKELEFVNGGRSIKRKTAEMWHEAAAGRLEELTSIFLRPLHSTGILLYRFYQGVEDNLAVNYIDRQFNFSSKPQRLLVLLRDGQKLMGMRLSFDQYDN
ncbi:small nuclear ribonucleoprotein family protein [Striga asiatica]|uniref:Small nuclear ribonucleoprotein family protein n=1 Tax=Striga asiatica TaxID=4170 RepID=A0A5A7QZX5_STRAF|nr:small nuclear ribonucleoprotein family protein [Striga asiatica]